MYELIFTVWYPDGFLAELGQMGLVPLPLTDDTAC
jgi:hypothetical protein